MYDMVLNNKIIVDDVKTIITDNETAIFNGLIIISKMLKE